MKTETILMIGAGAAAIYFLTRPGTARASGYPKGGSTGGATAGPKTGVDPLLDAGLKAGQQVIDRGLDWLLGSSEEKVAGNGVPASTWGDFENLGGYAF